MTFVRVERIKDPKPPSKPLWLTGFTDLVMLLLTFFIMLFATTQPKEEPWAAATESIRLQFGGEKNITPITGNVGHEKANASWLGQNSDPGLDLAYLYSVIEKQLAKNQVLSDIVLSQNTDSVILSFGSDVTFSSGKDTLSESGQVLVARLVPLLQTFPNQIEIVGHTDSNPVDTDGIFGSNWHLSLARAQTVATALKESGYMGNLIVLGRGTADKDLLPKNLPDSVRNGMARRVDIRLGLMQP